MTSSYRISKDLIKIGLIAGLIFLFMEVRIELIDINSPLYSQELKLRDEVLRIPIGMSIQQDDLSDEPDQLHFIAVSEQRVVGVVVLKVEEQTGKLRQMAVSSEMQGQNLGKRLVNALEEHARLIGLTGIKLHARHYAVGFYEKLGYTKTSKPAFEEVGMEHYEMEKAIY